MSKKYTWYVDDELIIDFDKKPARPEIRYPEPTDTKEIRLDKKKKPIYIRKAFEVSVEYRGIPYIIPIKEGLCTDGSTIIKLFWTIIGQNNLSPDMIIASIPHDIICIEPYLVDYDRVLSTKIFKALCITGGVPRWKVNLMGFLIDCWQFITGEWDSSIKGIFRKIFNK